MAKQVNSVNTGNRQMEFGSLEGRKNGEPTGADSVDIATEIFKIFVTQDTVSLEHHMTEYSRVVVVNV